MSGWPEGGLDDGPVRLRGWAPDDVPQLLELLLEPTWRQWSPTFEAATPASVLERIQQARAVPSGQVPPTLAVVDAAQPRTVFGCLDWRNGFPTPPFSIVDVGYAVAPRHRGRGLAGTALRLFTTWLLDPLGGDVHRVQLDHAVENEPSCRTALRAGLVVEGRREAFLPLRADPGAAVVRHAVCLHGRVRSAAG